MTLLRVLIVFFVLLSSLSASAHVPAGQKSLGSFGAWHAFTFNEVNAPVCYMALDYNPPKSLKIKRGEGRLTITERPGDNSKDVVSYSAGYILKSGASVTIDAGKSSFDLFTVKDEAWTRDTATDRKLTQAIRTNTSLLVTGIASQKGTPTVKDKLDLTGAAKAYAAITKACGMETDADTPAKAPAKPAKSTKK